MEQKLKTKPEELRTNTNQNQTDASQANEDEARNRKKLGREKGGEEVDQDWRAFSISARNLHVESVIADLTLPLNTQAGVTGLNGDTNILQWSSSMLND